MLNSNLNLSTLPESTFTYQFVNSALLFPCMEYQRLLRTEKVASIAENFSEYIANEPKVSYRDDRFGQCYLPDGGRTSSCKSGGRKPGCTLFCGNHVECRCGIFL